MRLLEAIRENRKKIKTWTIILASIFFLVALLKVNVFHRVTNEARVTGLVIDADRCPITETTAGYTRIIQYFVEGQGYMILQKDVCLKDDPRNKEITVYYNAANPADAVVGAEGWEYAVIVAPLVIIAMAATLM